MQLTSRSISRRSLLRGTALGGAGLAGAYLLGCSDGDSGATAQPSPTLAPTPPATAGSGLTWEQLLPNGAIPPPRKHHSLVLRNSEAGARLYLFGGRNNTGDLSDLWMYDVGAATWTALATSGPAARHGHNAVWDTVNDRLLVFGGQQGSSFFNHTWQYTPDDDRWAELAPEGVLPAPRYGAGGAYSPPVAEDTISPLLPSTFIITHGFTSNGRFDDTWAFDVTTDTWSDVSPADERPVERCLMRATWDTLRNRLVMFGGQTTDDPFLDDLWTLSSGRGWTTVLREPRPTGRTFYSFVYDAQREQVVLFGGNTATGASDETWLLHVQDEFWTQEEPSGDRPPSLFGHDAVWMAGSSSMLMFGGEAGGEDVDQLWELRISD